MVHVHPWLRITINNQSVTIPANIGIVASATGTCFEPLHTHDASGIIHVEATDASTVYTLGHFFQIWNATYGTVTINGSAQPIVFSSTDILGFKKDQTRQVKLLVDGQQSSEYDSLPSIPLDYCSATIASVPRAVPQREETSPTLADTTSRQAIRFLIQF